MAESLFTRALSEQDDDDLRKLAEESNVVANLIGFIEEEYDEYHRDNYRYDFVQKKVAPFLDKYRTIGNEFKGYRNQAYFNLGRKAAMRGDTAEAFFLFRDAHRLSTFVAIPDPKKGMRYQAELEMKKLLGLEDAIGTFDTWVERR